MKERRVKEVEIMLREASNSDKEKMGGEEVSTMRQMEVSSSLFLHLVLFLSYLHILITFFILFGIQFRYLLV